MGKRKNTGDPVDIGTPEFGRRRKVVPVKMRSSVLVKVVDSTAIDRCLMRNHVDAEQHSVLVAFSNDCYTACMLGPRASDYGRPIGTGAKHEVSDREAAALQRVGKAIDLIDARAGRDVREALLRLVMQDTDQSAHLINAASDMLVMFYQNLRHAQTREN